MKNSQNRSPMDMTDLLCCLWTSGRIESEDSFVSVVRAIVLLRAPQPGTKHKSHNEAADMSPPRNTSTFRRGKELGCSLQQVESEPKPHIEKCRNLEEERNEDDRDKHNDRCQREEPHVTSKHARNGARRTDGRNDRRWIKDGVCQRSAESAGQVEGEIASMPEPVFHCGTEQPQRPHVDDKVQPAVMHERIC